MWTWLTMLVVSPVLEEVIFRHGVQATLQRQGLRNLLANVLTAGLFAAAHLALNPSWLALATFVPALWLGHVYAQRQSLWPCIGWHSAMNLCWLAVLGPALAS